MRAYIIYISKCQEKILQTLVNGDAVENLEIIVEGMVDLI
jgi:hypothetical protein